MIDNFNIFTDEEKTAIKHLATQMLNQVGVEEYEACESAMTVAVSFKLKYGMRAIISTYVYEEAARYENM